MSKQEANMAYALIEQQVPFPTSALQDHAPLQCKLSQAHARATSVHPGCAHAHMIALASSRLSAVKMNYSNLLGVFPNLLMIITGATGDGKSIPLWLDTMTMHMYRKKEFKLAMKQYKKDMRSYNDAQALRDADPAGAAGQAPPPEEPTKPKKVDELYDAGSTVGLGQMMKTTSGRAVWLKHEARKLLKKLLEGGPSGSFDEINQVAEHAYYRNSPANENSKFSIENPHLVAIWLIHLEELEGTLRPKAGKDDDDSVAGLARFFIAHFPARINKLLPAGCGDENAEELVESEQYFNTLDFDEIVTASVNILLILQRLFVRYSRRADENGQKKRYSELLGLRTLPFDEGAWKDYVEDFNKCSDKVIKAQSKVKTRVDAGKLSKEKTNLLQFAPTVDLLEKVIKFLLPTDMDEPQIDALTPEELVIHLAEAKIDDILNSFSPETISAHATRNSVLAGKALRRR